MSEFQEARFHEAGATIRSQIGTAILGSHR